MPCVGEKTCELRYGNVYNCIHLNYCNLILAAYVDSRENLAEVINMKPFFFTLYSCSHAFYS